MKYFLLSLFLIAHYIDAGNSEKKIFLLLSNSNSIYNKGALGFQSSFTGKSEVVDIDQFDTEEKIDLFFKTKDSDNTLAFVSFGPEATTLSLKYTTTIPVIYSFVYHSRDYFKTEKNLCGIEMKGEPKEILRTLKEFKPESTSLIAFYSNQNSGFLLQEYEYIDLVYNLYLKKIQVTGLDNLKLIAEEEIIKADAVLLVSDPIYDFKGFNFLSELVKKHKKILISPLNSLVDLGSTFTVASDNIQLGEELGKFVNRVMDNEIECKKGPIFFPMIQYLYINKDYADSSGIEIPDSILRRRESDRLSLLGIELYYRKMYNSSKTVFEFIKNNFPENKIYREYLDNLSVLVSKEKLESLLSEADSNAKKNNYKKSYEIYKNILKLYPNSNEIKEKLLSVQYKESEDKRFEAKKLSQNLKNFEAIIKLNESLRIYPKNIQAKNDLEFLKNEEKKKYVENFQKAIQFYNNRNYDKTLEILYNLLLIDPVDNKIQEYIRLSKIKNDSLLKLQKCKNNPDDSCGPIK